MAVQDVRPNQGVFWEAANLATLRTTWQRAIDDGADYVVINTWNDYSEHTSIAPSAAHGHTFVDISAYYAEWFRTGTPPAIVRDALYVTHRTQPAGADPVRSHQQMAIRNGERDPARDTVEVQTFLRQDAEVIVHVGASTYQYTAAAGVDQRSFPLEAGSVEVRAERAGTIVGEVNSPFDITGTPMVEDLQYVAAGSRR